MSLELTSSASLAYDDGTSSDELSISDIITSVSTQAFVHLRQLATTSAAALNLGGISAPGEILIINRDATNFVELRASSGGSEAIRLLPGGPPARFRCGTLLQTPFLKADTASCWVEYLLAAT